MKKIILFAFAIVALSSCKKEENVKPTPPPVVWSHIVFSGSLSSVGYVSINDVPKQLNVAYEVKSGDVAKYVDHGNDETYTLYPSNGGPSTTYVTQGYTSGYIIADLGVTVASYNGNGDCNLYYTVK